MDTCIYIAESLHCSPETITTLLIGYTPKQNVFGVKKNLTTTKKNDRKVWLKKKKKEKEFSDFQASESM